MSRRRTAYIRIGRLISPVALVGLRIVTMITRQPRVRVLVTNEYGEILLVRGVISHLGWWTLPGGGVNRGEELAHAASRELREETGIKKPARDFVYLRTIEKSELGLHFTAPIFHIIIKKSDLPKDPYNPIEIAAIGWFKPDGLSQETTPIVFVALDELTAADSNKKPE